MGYPVYMVPAGDTLPIFFDTFDGGTGASITMTGLAVTDIEIYKDGSTTQRASDSGYALLDTDGIDFDGITGIHGFSIDTSDNTDSGFYTTGSWFHVVVSTITVDSQTLSFVAAAFRIVAAESVAGYPLVDVGAISGDATAADNLEAYSDGTTPQPVNVTQLSGDSTAADNAEAFFDDTGFNASNSTIGTCTTNSDMRGTDSALLAASAPANFGDLAITSTTGRVDVGSIEGSDATDQIRDAIVDDATRLDASALNTAATAVGSDGTGLTEAGGTGDHLTALATAAALATVDTVVDGIKAVTDNLPDSGALSSIAQASALATVDGIVDDLKLGVLLGTAATGTLTTTVFTTSLTGYADDQLIGRVVIFTAGDADGEASVIDDYASSGGTITVSPALTTAPGNGDAFKVV